MSDDDALNGRLKGLLEDAVSNLDAIDREARIAWCRTRNQHGVRMRIDADGLLEFVWGGRRLALVRAADLVDGEPLQAEFVADLPDHLPDDWAH